MPPLSAAAAPAAVAAPIVGRLRRPVRRAGRAPATPRATPGDGGSPDASDDPFRAADLMLELTETEDLGKRGESLFAAQLALCGIVVFGAPDVVDGVAAFLGVSSVIVGLGACVWGARTMGTSLTPLTTPRRGAALVTDGPFALVRHPLYSGLGLAALGAAVVSCALTDGDPSRVAAALLLIPIFAAKIDREEHALALQFGDDWTDYAKRVPRKVVPTVQSVAEALHVNEWLRTKV